MESVTLAGIETFAPFFAFAIVAVVVFAGLRKSGIFGENAYAELFVSLIVSTVFVSVRSLIDLVLNFLVWFVVIIMALFFMVLISSLIGKQGDFQGKGVLWVFVALMGIAVLFSFIKVFAVSIGPYVPGPFYGQGSDPVLIQFFDWLYHPRVLGGFVLLFIGGIVSFILIKGGPVGK
jgi:hypothetical protein